MSEFWHSISAALQNTLHPFIQRHIRFYMKHSNRKKTIPTATTSSVLKLTVAATIASNNKAEYVISTKHVQADQKWIVSYKQRCQFQSWQPRTVRKYIRTSRTVWKNWQRCVKVSEEQWNQQQISIKREPPFFGVSTVTNFMHAIFFTLPHTLPHVIDIFNSGSFFLAEKLLYIFLYEHNNKFFPTTIRRIDKPTTVQQHETVYTYRINDSEWWW